MKRLLIALLIACMVLSLVACTGTKDNNDDGQNDTTVGDTDVSGENESGDESGDVAEVPEFDYENEDLTKYVKLGEYKGLKATKHSEVLTDEEFVNYMTALLEECTAYEHITDRAIVEGDKVIIDYTGSMDGSEFAGGASVGVEVIAGDGNGYIPGFGAALIGHMPEEEFSVDMAFPDDYKNNPDFAGKAVTFKYYVHYIKGEEYTPTLDTIDDAFVKENFGMDTVESCLAYQREGAEMQKSYSVISSMNLELWNQVLDNSEVLEYPEGTVEATYQEYRDMYEYYASYYGTDYDTFLAEYVGATDAELLEECKGIVKEELVLYALVKELDANVTQAEIDGKVAFFAELYGVKNDEIINYYGEESLKKTALYDKILAIVASYGEITEAE